MKIEKLSLNKITDLLIISLPIAYLLGSPFINIILVIGSIIFLINSNNYNEWKWLKIYWVRIFLFFWFYLILNSFFATDIFNAFRASFSLIRFLLFSLLISYYGFKIFSLTKVINFWKLILLIVLIDIFIQFIFGYNSIGLPKHGPRYSGFFGNELVAGCYIFKLSAPIIGLLYYKIFFNFQNKVEFINSIAFCLFSLFICLITGERMNFLLFSGLAIFLAIIIFLFKKKFKSLFLFIISVVFTLFILLVSSEAVKSRYFDMINIVKNFDQSTYGKLFSSGYRLWVKNPFFGVGVKNFRVECDVQLTDILPENPAQLCSSHPHNLYLELLSETGVIGTTIFIILFFVYFRGLLSQKIFDLSKKKNCIMISCIISSLLIIWPIGTAGSFYTTWNGSFLWVQIGIINYLFYRKNISL